MTRNSIWARCNFSRLLAPCIAGVLLAGCSPDHRASDIGKCIAKAQQESPSPVGLSSEELHDAVGSIVAECMKDLGYRHELTDEKCTDDVDFNATCYVPRH